MRAGLRASGRGHRPSRAGHGAERRGPLRNPPGTTGRRRSRSRTQKRWRVSSYSGGQGECVEVADNLFGLVLVRDSKRPSGPALAFSPPGAPSSITSAENGVPDGVLQDRVKVRRHQAGLSRYQATVAARPSAKGIWGA
ncbi:DUF397 domain-containing protein [Streptomyces achromogenes]|uniref:DUF397 domain-containing protein n=1 Tax=Streptomyces achromogenes TaxID=67255 RepID=UPI0027D8CF3F|nr:DUF397 domain-containing protein [Streptomyces achromogenes]